MRFPSEYVGKVFSQRIWLFDDVYLCVTYVTRGRPFMPGWLYSYEVGE